MPAPAVGSKRPGEKLEQQKEQNRVQARIARQKKKQQVEELKAKVAQLAQEKVHTLCSLRFQL
jgi:bZIP transcription factor